MTYISLFARLLPYIMALVTGLIVGIIVERLRFKHRVQMERIRMVAPMLHEIYPTLEKIAGDTDYVVNLRQRKNISGITDPIKALLEDLGEYRTWDNKYREAGLELNLRHISKGLNDSLNAMRIYAINAKLQGENYVHGILDEMQDTCNKCIGGIRKF